MMFQKQNTHNNSFPCERCEWSCEPFYKIIHTLKAFITNAYSNHVNDVNHFLAHARERKKCITSKFIQNIAFIKNTLTRETYIKSFTSLTCVIRNCFYKLFCVNDSSKSFTRSFTSFTWVQ